MLIELPFASFFLSKMLGQHNINVDIDHLQSLDPVLYKNLLSLKVSVQFHSQKWHSNIHNVYKYTRVSLSEQSD